MTENYLDAEIDVRIAKASKAFGALWNLVFCDHHLSIPTKQHVNQACVLSTLPYGSECWALLHCHLRKLDDFHHRCIKMSLGITKKYQWKDHISSAAVRRQWSDVETISTKLRRHRIELLGNAARMADHHLSRPFHGPKRQWLDTVKSDFQSLGIDDSCWCDKSGR